MGDGGDMVSLDGSWACKYDLRAEVHGIADESNVISGSVWSYVVGETVDCSLAT